MFQFFGLEDLRIDNLENGDQAFVVDYANHGDYFDILYYIKTKDGQKGVIGERGLALTTRKETKAKTIQDRFDEFHSKNPHVYTRLVEMARRWKTMTGESKVGIGMLFEVLRWDSGTKVATQEPFKLSNDFRSRYSRLIMENEPDLRGVFNTRQLEAV
jgi:hypothetical protein